MTFYGRINLRELSSRRISTSITLRLREILHSLTWKYSPIATKNREKLEKCKEIHYGGRCFIIANGPSLRKINLELLKDEITFGLNRIYLLFEQMSLRPTYYVAMNELILGQFSEEIQELNMLKFLNWNRRRLFTSEDPKILFLKSKMVIKDSFQKDLTKPLVMGGTVTFVALQIAYFMGFQKVILIGLDHNYVEKGIPNVAVKRTVDNDLSHFHPQYFPKGSKWQLPDLVRSELDYKLARRAFEAEGREIIDATIDGKCQIFKKEDFTSLF